MPIQKAALFSRHQPGGVFTIVDEANFTTGNIFFVDSGSATGADSVGAGRNPDLPFLTIDYAVGQCTANNGDYIIAMPGHAAELEQLGHDVDRSANVGKRGHQRQRSRRPGPGRSRYHAQGTGQRGKPADRHPGHSEHG